MLLRRKIAEFPMTAEERAHNLNAEKFLEKYPKGAVKLLCCGGKFWVTFHGSISGTTPPRGVDTWIEDPNCLGIISCYGVLAPKYRKISILHTHGNDAKQQVSTFYEERKLKVFVEKQTFWERYFPTFLGWLS